MVQIDPSTLASIALWLTFAALVYTVARYAPLWCLPLGHAAVAFIINQKHAVWIDHEMRRPGWDGVPDKDIIYAAGVIADICSVCIALLPVTAIGLWLKWRHVRRTAHGGKTALGVSFL